VWLNSKWFNYSLGTMLSFTGLLLGYKYLGNRLVLPPFIMLFLFFFTVIPYVGHILAARYSLRLNFWAFFFVFIAAVFSYLGNIFYIESFNVSPNAGYVVAIVGSKAVVVTLLSVLLYRSHFGLLQFFGVCVCISGVIVLSWPTEEASTTESSSGLGWIAYALIANLCFAGMVLLYKKLGHTRVNGSLLPMPVTLFYLFGIGTILYFIHVSVLYFNSPDVVGNPAALLFNTSGVAIWMWVVIIATGVFMYVGNICFIKAVSMAPNPGYAVAIESTKAVLIAVASYFLFSDDLEWMHSAGVLLCVVGVTVITQGEETEGAEE